jgi:hypothetical protein
MKRQLVYALTLTATFAASVIPASVIPAYGNPVPPSSRSGNSGRAMCNDVYLGQNVQNNVHERKNIVDKTQNNVGSSSNAWSYMNSTSGYKQNSASGGGGFSVFGIGASGHGGSSSSSGYKNASSSNSSSSSYFDKTSHYFHDKSTFDDTSSSTAVVGQDCSAVVQSQTAITQQLIGW